jgi:hypothetical protein
MKKIFINLFSFCFCLIILAQNNSVQNAAQMKDAQVDVTVSDFKNNLLPHEILVFKSRINQREYEGLTNDSGVFSVRLPAGDKYDIYILGFKDSTSYDVLDIPALAENTSYKKPFILSFQFLPAKNWTLSGCNFESGKAILEEESYGILDDLVAYMVRKEDDRIEVAGYTDNVGSAASNIKLSQDRAEVVKAYLETKGISGDRIIAKGYGMSNPIDNNKTDEGRANNRRTEVNVLQ